jgi:L-methionine (R)-S-oxide reductase
MAESFSLLEGAREEMYGDLMPQWEALCTSEPDRVAVLANTAAMLRQGFGFFWVGFYVVDYSKEPLELVLGPFQGDVACTRIGYGKGVCGAAWAEKRTQLVPDVEAFPGHIACSALSRSEIVVPILKDGEVVAVLDVDSDKLANFSETDVEGLTQLCTRLAAWF